MCHILNPGSSPYNICLNSAQFQSTIIPKMQVQWAKWQTWKNIPDGLSAISILYSAGGPIQLIASTNYVNGYIQVWKLRGIVRGWRTPMLSFVKSANREFFVLVWWELPASQSGIIFVEDATNLGVLGAPSSHLSKRRTLSLSLSSRIVGIQFRLHQEIPSSLIDAVGIYR